MNRAAADWSDPVLAAAIMATAPAGLAVQLRIADGTAADGWLALLQRLLPAGAPWRRCPTRIDHDRLLGGLDLAASLSAGRRVVGDGLLAETDGGVVVLRGAERLPDGLAARLGAALEDGALPLDHGDGDGLPARFGLVALVEHAVDAPAALPSPLRDRVALTLSPEQQTLVEPPGLPEAIRRARTLLDGVAVPDAVSDALCRAALSCGIGSLRAPLLALRVARIVAALHGRDRAGASDAAAAARLVLGPRATVRPGDGAEDTGGDQADPPERPEAAGTADTPEPAAGQAEPERAPAAPERDGSEEAGGEPDRTAESVLQAVRAALPPEALAALRRDGTGRAGDAGRTEPARAAAARRRDPPRRGRPIGTEPGDPARRRLHLPATLLAALPWQLLRRRYAPGRPDRPDVRLLVRREDFRVVRFAPRVRLTTIFALDASGSSARARLAEAKGCVGLLLADCYARRDQVAIVCFRGRGAETLLSPTGSVLRARRALDGMPGGGGTPLAAGIEAAGALAALVARTGGAPLLVLLTDGRANVRSNGDGDRGGAFADALSAADRVLAARLPALLVDISPAGGRRAAEDPARPHPVAALAARMGARLLSLPVADPRTLAAHVAGLAADRDALDGAVAGRRRG